MEKKKLQSELLKFIESSLKEHGNSLFINLSEVTPLQLVILRDMTGINFSKYIHSLDASGVKHALKHKNIQVSDLLLIPLIIENFDTLSIGKEPNTLVYTKLIGQEYFYVEEIRKGRKKLVLKTLYKRKKRHR